MMCRARPSIRQNTQTNNLRLDRTQRLHNKVIMRGNGYADIRGFRRSSSGEPCKAIRNSAACRPNGNSGWKTACSVSIVSLQSSSSGC